jgi:D-alanyl-D-alanine carboxypeptidase
VIRRGSRWTATLAITASLIVAVPAQATPGRWDPLPPPPRWVNAPPPDVSAPSWILFDDQSDWVISAHDPDGRRAPASTTKIMTALVVAEHAAFDEMVTVSASAPEAGESEIGIVEGESISVADLLSAVLVRSANDAALALAEHVGGSVEGFAALMNEKAQDLGMTNSHFLNPHGLDEEGHYTTAVDELKMAQALMANPQLASMVALRRIDFPTAPDGTQRGGLATNQLLDSYPGATGVKTGYTFQASLVLAAAAEREGRRLFAIVMGSEGSNGHFVDADALLDYGFEEARIPTTVSEIDLDGPLGTAARGETLTWLALSGLLVSPPPPTTPTAVTVIRQAEEPPDWPEALSWVETYWNWIVAGGG